MVESQDGVPEQKPPTNQNWNSYPHKILLDLLVVFVSIATSILLTFFVFKQWDERNDSNYSELSKLYYRLDDNIKRSNALFDFTDLPKYDKKLWNGLYSHFDLNTQRHDKYISEYLGYCLAKFFSIDSFVVEKQYETSLQETSVMFTKIQDNSFKKLALIYYKCAKEVLKEKHSLENQIMSHVRALYEKNLVSDKVEGLILRISNLKKSAYSYFDLISDEKSTKETLENIGRILQEAMEDGDQDADFTNHTESEYLSNFLALIVSSQESDI